MYSGLYSSFFIPKGEKRFTAENAETKKTQRKQKTKSDFTTENAEIAEKDAEEATV